MELLILLAAKAPAWLTAVGTIVTASSAVTALTPTKVDDKALGFATKGINVVLKVLNILSLNILMNKNVK